MTIHNSSQDEMIPGRGDSRRATEAVDTLDYGGGRGDRWRDDDGNNVGIGIGIVIGPDSGGNDGNCTSSLCPRVEDHVAKLCVTTTATMAITRRPFTQEVEDCGAEPHVAPRQAATRVGGDRQ